MCGLFAFVGSRPDPELLAAAAGAAGRRGPHGCGWVSRECDPAGVARTKAAHQAVPLADVLDQVRQLSAGAIIGHARLATVGDWRRVDQLQPFTVAGHALAHNGVIRNADDLAPGHPTDSAALAHAYAALRTEGMHPFAALDKLVELAEHEAWAIAVLDTSGLIYVNRHYHPIYLARTPAGVYMSSQRFHPDAQLVPGGTTVSIGAS